MRAPSLGSHFVIPYSGTPHYGDCILVAEANGFVSVAARYYSSGWSHEDYITDFSDENNVISFNANRIGSDSCAAFLPGPY